MEVGIEEVYRPGGLAVGREDLFQNIEPGRVQVGKRSPEIRLPPVRAMSDAAAWAR